MVSSEFLNRSKLEAIFDTPPTEPTKLSPEEQKKAQAELIAARNALDNKLGEYDHVTLLDPSGREVFINRNGANHTTPDYMLSTFIHQEGVNRNEVRSFFVTVNLGDESGVQTIHRRDRNRYSQVITYPPIQHEMDAETLESFTHGIEVCEPLPHQS